MEVGRRAGSGADDSEILYRFWFPAGGKMPWETASTQRHSGYRRFDPARSVRGYLWRKGCGAQVLVDMFAGMEVECWGVRWMG